MRYQKEPKMSTDMKGIISYIHLRSNLKQSFGLKLFKSFTLAIVVVLLIFTTLFVYYQNKAVKEQLVKEGKMLAGLLAFNSRTAVFAENAGLLKDAVQGVMNQKNVMGVSIYTAEGRVLISEQKNSDWKDPGIRGDGKGTLPKPEE